MPLLVDQQVVEFRDLELISQLAKTRSELVAVASFLQQWYDNSDTILSMTSGSTGPPKQISIQKKVMIKSAEKTEDYFRYKQGDAVLNSLPIKFIAGRMMLIRAIVSNLNLIVVEPTSLPLTSIRDVALAFVPMTPYQLQSTIASCPEKLSQVSKILLGGGPVSNVLLDHIASIDSTIYHGYGMTETITHIAIRNLTNKEEAFRPLTGVNISVGANNELVVNADHLPSEVVTTDLVTLRDDNSFIWLGRMDNVINSGGVKVMPEVVEQKLKQHLPCNCLVIGQEDVLLGEKVVLILESNTEPALLQTILEERLDRFEKPKAILLLPEFKRTETLKIQRKATLEAALNNI